MPRKTRNPMPADAGLPDIPKEFLDQLVTGPMTAEGVEAIMAKLKKAVIERALGAEMSHHLGYAPGAVKPDDTVNHRNGTSGKTVLTDDGQGAFEPKLIGKHERRFAGFDDKIIKTRGHFPSDDAATKLIWLALRNITSEWSRAAHDWKMAMNQFAILYEDRFDRVVRVD